MAVTTPSPAGTVASPQKSSPQALTGVSSGGQAMHEKPSPVNPSLHVQASPPGSAEHVAFASQAAPCAVHIPLASHFSSCWPSHCCSPTMQMPAAPVELVDDVVPPPCPPLPDAVVPP